MWRRLVVASLLTAATARADVTIEFERTKAVLAHGRYLTTAEGSTFLILSEHPRTCNDAIAIDGELSLVVMLSRPRARERTVAFCDPRHCTVTKGVVQLKVHADKALGSIDVPAANEMRASGEFAVTACVKPSP
jgi:hypothetical protein